MNHRSFRSLVFGLFLTSFFANNYVFPMQEDISQQGNVLEGASYFIYEGADPEDIIGINSATSHWVTFYTCDGEEVEKIKNVREATLFTRLDPNAPKPQPVTCKIRWWPAFTMPFGGTKGVPGWFICFYDKNGNQIDSYQYDIDAYEINVYRDDMIIKFEYDESSPQSIDEDFPLDLSKIQEVIIEEINDEDSDPAYVCMIL